MSSRILACLQHSTSGKYAHYSRSAPLLRQNFLTFRHHKLTGKIFSQYSLYPATMVCDSCQSKASKICVPDKWKDGAKNAGVGNLKVGKTNKALAAQKHGAQWIPSENTCRLCKSKVQLKMHYCNDCAHKKGICSMCGKKTVDTSSHKMSLT